MPSSDSPLNDEATVLPKLSGIPLESLVDSADSVLNKAVARVLREASHGVQNYAAHSSSPAADPREMPDRAGVGKS